MDKDKESDAPLSQGHDTATRYDNPASVLTAPLTYLTPDLAAVCAAWPTLPDALKAGILAMVKATK